MIELHARLRQVARSFPKASRSSHSGKTILVTSKAGTGCVSRELSELTEFQRRIATCQQNETTALQNTIMADPDRQRNAMYVSNPAITHADVKRFHNIFDTEPESALYEAFPDYIRAVEDATWALNLDPTTIYEKHIEDKNPAFLRDPVVIMDDRTAKDESLLLLYPEYEDVVLEGKYELQKMRVAPRSLTPVLQNLEIANMDFVEFQEAVTEDGVFRGFP